MFDFVEVNRRRANLYSGCIGHFTDKNEGSLTALATIVLGGFTFALWWSTRHLWMTSLRQARHMQDTAERQLRAYIFARPDTVAVHLTQNLDGGEITIRYEIFNTGQTPAYDIYTINEIRIMPWPLPEDFVIEPVKNESGGGGKHHGPIGPNQRGAFSNTMEKYKPLKANERYYLLAVISYRDAFKQPRTTRLCVSPEITGLLANAHGGQTRGTDDMSFHSCAQHNDAD